jgi:5-methylcytosine-specific restriction endonuclease McrA
MTQPQPQRMRWRDNPNAVELEFDYYLTLIESRLKGTDVSLVQGLRRFYREELSIDLRETQARGLMHRESSVFRDYVQGIFEAEFLPNIEYWEAQGLERFLQWKADFYRVRNIEAVDIDIEERDSEAEIEFRGSDEPPDRRETKVNRVIRDSALSRFLKSLYNHQCQICKFTFLLTAGRRYAETHHIRPLGRKHNGIDKETNMIVLCPNHHAMMDFGAIAIHPEQMTVISADSTYPEHQQPLQLRSHSIDRDFLEYHLENIFGKV